MSIHYDFECRKIFFLFLGEDSFNNSANRGNSSELLNDIINIEENREDPPSPLRDSINRSLRPRQQPPSPPRLELNDQSSAPQNNRCRRNRSSRNEENRRENNAADRVNNTSDADDDQNSVMDDPGKIKLQYYISDQCLGVK